MQKIIYAILCLVGTLTFAQAQINEVSISSNPILQKHHAEKEQRTQQMLAGRSTIVTDVEARDVFVVNGQCLESDSLYQICIDTFGFGAASTVTLFNTGMLNFGTATLDTNCVSYVADSNIDFGIDSIYIEFCGGESGTCDTTIYPVYVHRPNNLITLPTTFVNAEDTVTICVNNVLPGVLSSANIISNNTELGDAFALGDCIFYRSNRFAETDVVTLELCDDFCICDTYQIPIASQRDTMSLPFMDDFSYDGPFTNDNWVNSNVFVNNTMAVNPVSVGVATFDGLNAAGAPYNGGYGSSDNLTSAYLDLSPYSAASNVYLSFYVQPKGLGDSPKDRDSLILEFKNSAQEWVLVDTFKYRTSLTDTVPGVTLLSDRFNFYSYHINQNDYLFDGFQFRFRGFSTRSGNIDHWHLDYVRLVEGVDGSPFLADVAFTEVPNDILKNYSSMPWWHFVENIDGEIPDENRFNEIHLYNHNDEQLPFNTENFDLIEMETGTVVVNNLNLLQTATNIAPGRIAEIFPALPQPTYPTFVTSVKNDFADDLKYLEFEKTYSISINAESPSLNPIVDDNNVVRHTTIFDDYFAYDDGTAETGLEATTDQVQIAVKYTANVADTLKAIQIHFPHINTVTSNQLFNLRVWIGELDGEAEYELILQKPLYIDSYLDSLNGFTTYVLTDILTGENTPLFIPAGDFYIGWQQVSVCALNQCIAVGIDKNNGDAMQQVFFDPFGFGSNWQAVSDANPSLTGALMMRPVVGEGTPLQSSKTEEFIKAEQITIFPNPTNGLVSIELEEKNYEQYSYTLFDAVGKRLDNRPLTNQLNISDLQNGIYFIKIINNKTSEVFNQKIILVK